MSVLSVSDVTQNLVGAIRRAAESTGAGFEYLLNTAQRESNLDPNAKAPSSSAAGAFQFVEQTWLEMVKTEGPNLGLSGEAQQIARTASGRYTVADPAAREKILALRYDPEVSAAMAGAFTNKNRDFLQQSLGRAPSDGELYIAHFLGAQGASDLIRLAATQPDTPASPYFPDAAAANRPIFYAAGKPRSVGQVYAELTRKHQNAGSEAAAAIASSVRPGAQPVRLAAATAIQEDLGENVRAYNETGPVFHSMFHAGRRTPVSSYVERVWANLPSTGAPGATGGGGAGGAVAAPTPAAAPAPAAVSAPAAKASEEPQVRSVRTFPVGPAPQAAPSAPADPQRVPGSINPVASVRTVASVADAAPTPTPAPRAGAPLNLLAAATATAAHASVASSTAPSRSELVGVAAPPTVPLPARRPKPQGTITPAAGTARPQNPGTVSSPAEPSTQSGAPEPLIDLSRVLKFFSAYGQMREQNDRG